MKVEQCCDYLLIYLNNYYLFDFDNKDMIEKDIKKIFKKLKRYYHINLKGSYKVDILKDDYYGVILKIKEDNYSYDYFYKDKLSLKIKLKKVEILYEINDIFNDLDNAELIKDRNTVYLKLKNIIGKKEYLNLIENSKMHINYDI